MSGPRAFFLRRVGGRRFGFRHLALGFFCIVWVGSAEPVPRDALFEDKTGEEERESKSAGKSLPENFVPPSSFLNTPAHGKTLEEKKLEEHQRLLDQLEAGRQHRLAGRVEQARACFIPLLESNAASDIQQPALLELGLLAEQEHEYSRAQQVYNQFLKRFPDSPACPEVLLRQGLMYRDMGAPTLALAKFYTVGTSALQLKEGNLDAYKRNVLQAQTEIANTYFLQGKYDDAIDFFQRLLKQDNADLQRSQIHYKLIQCQERLGHDHELEAAAREFLKNYPDSAETPEVRFLLANVLKKMGRMRDSLQEIQQLLVAQDSIAKTNRAAWTYWQQRTGNEIANQLYQEGDYINALLIYESLLPLSRRLDWQVPLSYQIGLVYEKLAQPAKAEEAYRRLVLQASESSTNLTASLMPVVEMAKWRSKQVEWQTRAVQTNQFFGGSLTSPPRSGEPAPPERH